MAGTLQDSIARRRTIKPDKYTGATIADQEIVELLEAANWAPTHGYTEPWRFVVYTEGGKEVLIDLLHKLDVQANGDNEIRYSKLRARVERSSHIIAIVMKRGDNPKIPEIEEAQAVSAAVQNMWLLASEKGLGAYWSTGAQAYTPEMTSALGFNPEAGDVAMGFFYIGEFTGEWPEGRRVGKAADKVTWNRG